MANKTYADIFSDQLILHYGADGSLWTDTGGTNPAVDGNEVKAVSADADAQTSALVTGTNGPIYRANYAASGYKALEFDGVNDALSITASGITTNARMFCIMCYTWIGASNSGWCRGNGAGWCRGLISTTTHALQSSVGTVSGSGLANAKRVTTWIAGTGQSQVDSLGLSDGNQNNLMPSTASAVFTIGALNTGPFSQFGNFALHEIIVVGENCRWGDVQNGSIIMRDKWGVTDPNALPVVGGAGISGFPLSRLVN